jgi:hypothetical protein
MVGDVFEVSIEGATRVVSRTRYSEASVFSPPEAILEEAVSFM